MINKSYLSDVLKSLAKQNVFEATDSQNIDKLNKDATSNGEMLQYEIDDSKPTVKNNTTKITAKIAKLIPKNIKTSCVILF